MPQANSRRIGAALLIGAFAASTALFAQDHPSTGRGNPLPKGAVGRLGTLHWRHADMVTFIAFLPDGKAVLTGALDDTLRLWDRATGKELRRFTPPEPMPTPGRKSVGMAARRYYAALSRDGRTLAIATRDSAVQLWDVATGKAMRRLDSPPSGIAGIVFAPDGKTLALRGSDRTIHLVDANTGKELQQIQDDPRQNRIVTSAQLLDHTGEMAFAPDGKTLASAEFAFDPQQKKANSSIRISEVATGKEVRRIGAERRITASALVYSPDGKIIAYSYLNTIRLHEADSGKELHAINLPLGISSIAFAPDSKSLAVKVADRTVRFLDTASGEEVGKLGEVQPIVPVNAVAVTGAPRDTRALAFAPDGWTMAIGDGNTVRFWDRRTGKELPDSGHRGPVTTLHFAPDGKSLVSHGDDGTVRSWDLVDGQQRGSFRAPAGTVCIAVAPDGKTVACAGAEPMIHLVDAATGKTERQLKGHPQVTAALAFRPDGKLLVSASAADNLIRLHDPATGSELRHMTLGPQDAKVSRAAILRGGLRLAFSGDGRTLIAQDLGRPTPRLGATGPHLRLWDADTGKEIRSIAMPPTSLSRSMAVSPDGRAIAVVKLDGTLSLREAASGGERMQLGQPEPVTGNAPAMRNGITLTAAALSRRALVNPIAFSPDGTLLAGPGPEHSVRIWDVAAGKVIAHLRGHAAVVNAIAFSADGKRLATGSNDSTILLWDTAMLKQQSPSSGPPPDATEIAQRWADLAASDAARAFASIRRLAAHPEVAVPLLREHLKPAVPADPKRLAKLVADLDSDDFTVRDNANRELAQLGELALAELQKVMANPPTLETRRRAEALVARLTGGTLTADQLRVVRAVEVLEATATPEARKLLQALAGGAPGVLSTREARAALGRLR
jgi:WD40 repeat protein